MKKAYLELAIDVLRLSQEDIVTASLPEDYNVTDDPYEGSGWWN